MDLKGGINMCSVITSFVPVALETLVLNFFIAGYFKWPTHSHDAAAALRYIQICVPSFNSVEEIERCIRTLINYELLREDPRKPDSFMYIPGHGWLAYYTLIPAHYPR